jgi:hypothetical protein
MGQAEEITAELLVRPIVSSVLLGLIFATGYSFLKGDRSYSEKFRANFFPALGFAFPITLVGYVTGNLTGASRSPAVGNVIPAVLALLGGLNIYFFGSESKNKAIVGFCVSIFVLVFFYGLWGGVVNRENGRISRFLLLSEQERIIKAYRENRNMPAEPPDWLLKNDP